MIPASRATASASPLGTPLAAQQLDHLGGDQHPPGGRGRAGGDVLAGDVDHAGGAGLVDVGQPVRSAIRTRSSSSSAPAPGRPAPSDGRLLGHDDQRVGARPGRRSGASRGRRPVRRTAPARRRRPRRAGTAGGPAASVIAVGRAARRAAAGETGDIPISVRIAGSTNISKEMYAETGLPGSVTIGTRSSPTRPNPCGLPGCIATGAEPHALAAQRLLHDVVVALRDAARGDDEVGAGQLVVAASRGTRRARRGRCRPGAAIAPARRTGGRRAGRSCRRRSSRGRARSPGSRSSEPVERTTTRGRGRASTVGPADRGEQPDVAGPSTVPASTSRSPSRDVVAGRADVLAGLGRLVDADLGDAAVGPLVGHDRVGALRAPARRS